jgi:hypothetical protein
MTIQSALTRAEEISNWIDRSVHGLDIPSGDREVMAGALFDQVHEHQRAIQVLLKSSFVGSAFSLLRPTLETFVRGVWLWRCASDKEVENFAKDKINEKSFGTLIQEIEARPGYDVGVLSKVKKEAWSAMCSYAHGGYLQAVRRISPRQIAANYSEGEILEVINSSCAIALLAAHEIFSMAKRKDLLKEVLEQMRGASLTPAQ